MKRIVYKVFEERRVKISFIGGHPQYLPAGLEEVEGRLWCIIELMEYIG